MYLIGILMVKISMRCTFDWYPDSCKLNINQTFYGISEDLMSMGIPVSIAVSSKVSSLSSIGIEAQSTRKLLRKYLIFGKTSVIFSDLVNNSQSSSNFIWDSHLVKNLPPLLKDIKSDFFNRVRKNN